MALAEPWREAITRGARLVSLSPLVALGIAPFAVFFRSVLLILALWHAYAVWRFTTGGAPTATPRLGLWRWLLRALALAGVVLITLSYDSYRALLIATAAVYLAYLAELLPALGLSPRKRLRPAALAAVFCFALVAGNLLLRRWTNGAGWDLRGHLLSALALPFGLLAWLEVDRVRAPVVETKADAPWFPLRAWALQASQHIVPFGVSFSLGVVVVFASVAGGLASLWRADPELTPGDMRSVISFALLCFNGSILLVLRKRNPETLRRAVVGAGISHIPVWWLLVFPTQFDANAWKSTGPGSSQQDDMAEDLVYSRVLLGKTRSEIVQVLGLPGSYWGPRRQFYELNRGTCKGFMITFDERAETASKADFFWCL
jgi:hypothetical protein